MAGILSGLLDLLLPPLCAECGRSLEPRSAESPFASVHRVLCADCRHGLRFLSTRACMRCQEEVAGARAEAGESLELCAQCHDQRSPLHHCVASVVYEDRALSWIHQFKYPARGLAGLRPGPEAIVAALIENAAARVDTRPPDLVIPIPLHPNRVRERGFNPAASLARDLSRRRSPALAEGPTPRFAPDLLVRVRDTPSQTRLSRSARRKNVRGAFGCPSPERLQPHVLLVDDVVTTGSTLAEAARTLARNGVERIDAVCAARTPARDR
jgi:ComF family protein